MTRETISNLTAPPATLDRPMLQAPERFWSLAVGIAALVFAAIAPTLLWLEFSNSAEALNVATAMEIRRGDSEWLVPSLQGETRLAKPPLTAWITAASITNSTMRSIASSDPRERNRGYLQLAWETRWPALLAGCVMLLATAAMGRMIAGSTCGIVSIIAAGSSLLFLRFSRYGTTDIQLSMWVSLTNLSLMHAFLHRRRWSGFLLGGVFLGLAFMTKGPVALVESLVPMMTWLIYARWNRARTSEPAEHMGPCFLPILFGIGAFILVGLPWFVIAFQRAPNAASVWITEVTREGATESAGKWYQYILLFPYLSPWFVFAVGGAVIALLHRGRRELLPLFLLLVPVLIMSFFKDRNERYLLPMIPAASILAGIGVTELLSNRLVSLAHWMTVGAIGIGFPIAMSFIQPPWYSHMLGAVAASIVAAALIAGIIQQRWLRGSLIFMTLIIMLGLQALFISGYRETREGSAELRPMAENIFQMFPTAEAYNAHPRGKRPPPELGVYLNRVIKWTDDPSAMAPGTNPKLLFMLQDRSTDPAPAPPAGWRLVETRKRDKNFWWVFVLPPAS